MKHYSPAHKVVHHTKKWQQDWTGNHEYLIESWFLNTVHIRPGVWFYSVVCCFVAHCTVHQRLWSRWQKTKCHKYAVDVQNTGCRFEISPPPCQIHSLCHSWRGNSEGRTPSILWHTWWASGKSGGRGNSYRIQTTGEQRRIVIWVTKTQHWLWNDQSGSSIQTFYCWRTKE